MQLIVKNF